MSGSGTKTEPFPVAPPCPRMHGDTCATSRPKLAAPWDSGTHVAQLLQLCSTGPYHLSRIFSFPLLGVPRASMPPTWTAQGTLSGPLAGGCLTILEMPSYLQGAAARTSTWHCHLPHRTELAEPGPHDCCPCPSEPCEPCPAALAAPGPPRRPLTVPEWRQQPLSAPAGSQETFPGSNSPEPRVRMLVSIQNLPAS